MRKSQPHGTNPRPRMSDKVWCSGVAVVLLLWVLIVAVVGGLSGRPLEVALDEKLLTPFGLFLVAWTAGWRSSRSPGEPIGSSAPTH